MTPTTSCKPTDEDLKELGFRAGYRLAHPDPGEEICITGLSGSYPNSLNVYDFRDNLYNKQDLISDDNRRWDLKHPEIPPRGGRIYEIEKFDAGFFGVHFKQAHTMDPMGRILLEKAYEAIVDAGLHPGELRGTRCGVYVGTCFSEAEKTWFYEQIQPHGFGITGCIRAMLPNRLSYWLGVDGPSYTVDTACSSSLYALEHGYRGIRMGHCDTAIIGGCNVCLHPYVTLQFARLGVLNKDGKCKCFDESADGYTRSEAIIVIVLQRAKDSRRIYSRVVHAKTNCDGYKEQGITYPSGVMQNKLLSEFYNECEVNPYTVDYVEAHGTGTKVGDPEEVSGIEAIFCGESRKSTVMIGSVKSNIGHSEPASGLCSVTKVILSMENGYLIPNINFTTPRKEMKALNEGRMQVVTEKMKWNGGYSAISSFGFGGANCHVLLESHKKLKVNDGIASDNIPRLVYVSGRTEEAINCIIDDLAKRPLDSEYIGILHEVFKLDIPAHLYRGYAVFTKEKVVTRELDYFPYDNKPLWLVFSGLGSQWAGMGAQLMQIPVFAGAIEKCHQLLSKKGLNIVEILTNTNEKFSSITKSLVGITAIQIGLIELLNAIDVKPTGIIAHSIGELAAAYYDKALSLEQALLSAVYLGQATESCKNAIGAMISVEMWEDQLKEFLIPGVEIACENDEKFAMLAGTANKIEEIIKKFDASQIKYQRIASNNYALHCSLAEQIASLASKQLKTLIAKPNERTELWLSSSKMASKLCSAEFVSTLLSAPVLFEESYDAVPTNAVILEVSPHGVLQNFLKRSIYNDCIIIPLLLKDQNSAETFMAAIGKLYVSGHNPRIEKILPKVQFPVSKGTPMLSPLVKWDHTHDWYVTKFEVQDKINSGERTITVKLSDEDQEYLSGHVVDGRTLYPATGYLQIVWETLGMVRGQLFTELPVVFENVKFHRATNVHKDGRVHLVVMVQKVSGNFEVIESGTAVVTGRIYVPDDINAEMTDLPAPIPETNKEYVMLKSRDIYKELRLRGYNYSGLFRGLHSCDTTATVGEVYWKDNWISFMDTVLQMQILQVDTRGLFVPTAIQRLSIDSLKHAELIKNLSEEGTLPVHVYKSIKTIKCGGVEIRGLDASAISRKKPLGVPVLETYKFIPNEYETTLNESLRINLQLILENNNTYKVKTAENIENEISADDESLFSTEIKKVLEDLPLIQADLNVLTSQTIELPGLTVTDRKLSSETNCLVVIASDVLNRPQVLQAALNAISATGYILAREAHDIDLSVVDLTKMQIVLNHKLPTERLILLTKTTDIKYESCVDMSDEASETKFDWVAKLQTATKANPNTIIFAQGEPLNGIIGFANCIRKEPGLDAVRCMFIMDKDAPAFDPMLPYYETQLRKNIAVNVLKNGVWGTYRHLLLEPLSEIDVEHAYVNVTVRGDLSSLRWLQGGLSKKGILPHNRILCDVYVGALNFRDIMTATGRIAPEVVAHGRFDQDCVQGLEFAGRLLDGRRVFGMVENKALATLVSCDPQFMWPCPDHWSLEEAVTVPVVYGTVLYAFVIEGKIKPGMSVLIHAGSGGVGQAAINVALFYGCTVYTTVGTPEKREFIKQNWPQIKDNQIGNSRDCSFEQMINIETNKRGVDLVLNSLAEEKLQASIRCLARGGKFLEIGKFDLTKDNPLPLSIFKNDNSFHSVMLDTFFSSVSSAKQVVVDLITEAINTNCIKPLKRHVFKRNEIEEAFRFMATGKHMGKILIKSRDEEKELVVAPTSRIVKAMPRYIPTNQGVYIVTGGLGGFGLEMVDWLVLRGATKLVLTSRKGISTGYQAMRVKIWRSYGLELVISTEDITTYEGCRNLISTALEMGYIEAVFNLAVVLKDALFENQTAEMFEESFGPKPTATHYLDDLTRALCPKLRQFVVFSSVSCGRGNAGQTNYGMANSIMERICERRHEDGFPALAVEWGAIGDVGLVAEMQEEHTEIVIGGTLQQRISNCLLVLDQFLLQDSPVVASMLVAEKRAGDGSATNIVDAVVNILGIRDVKTVSIHSSLAELGMDSIMAVEIKQTLEREFEVFLTPQDIRSMTFARLQEIAAEREANPEGTGEPTPINVEIADSGLQFMMRAIGDEETASKPFVITPSQNPVKYAGRVILIPGIEGFASGVEVLAAQIVAETVTMQFELFEIDKTIREMALSMIERTPEYFTSNNFNIVGYSYGSNIALELASILESRGQKGCITVIDGSPVMLKKMTQEQVVATDDESIIQNNILNTLVGLLVESDIANYMKSNYEKMETWEEKIELIMTYGPKYTVHSGAYLKKMCNVMYRRLKAIKSYEPEIGKLNSTIKLMKPSFQSVAGMLEDFGLSEFTNQPVEVTVIEGNHVLIIDSSDLANKINKDLTGDETILKESFADKPDLIKIESVRS